MSNTVTHRVCPECGRLDPQTNITSHHVDHDGVECFGVPVEKTYLNAENDEARDLLERVYDQAVLNRGYVTSALLDEIRAKGLRVMTRLIDRLLEQLVIWAMGGRKP